MLLRFDFVLFRGSYALSSKGRNHETTRKAVFMVGYLSEALSDLLRAKGADAVKPETEQETAFLSHADVVG